MASLTVRGLDDEVKRKLRIRAATNGVSLEEEVRRTLGKAVAMETTSPGVERHFVDVITGLADQVGGFELDLPSRSSDWQPPDFSDFPFDPDGASGGQDRDRER